MQASARIKFRGRKITSATFVIAESGVMKAVLDVSVCSQRVELKALRQSKPHAERTGHFRNL